ncbi:MAG: hypothetical protein U5Q03_13600 [Bacteroidota bacterium]|nr:hypothetical protein [Bacteroidota bacterium]
MKTVFIGYALADYNAATENGLEFYFKKNDYENLALFGKIENINRFSKL